MPETRKADAVMIPESFKSGDQSYHRIASVLDVAEPLLGIGLAQGKPGHFRHTPYQAPDGSAYLLCTPNRIDNLLHPKGHPKAGQPRFRWEPLDGGPIKLGYLIEEQDGRDGR